VTGAVCASLLAARGVAVTLFDSGRGPGGRMAQRRCSPDLLSRCDPGCRFSALTGALFWRDGVRSER
uniref:Amine oxidase domain-containing protein n=1 Tax=Aegilops tauschii subsp. strangulata TaxID=200361 RepID=A0A453LZJ9_AEGTS